MTQTDPGDVSRARHRHVVGEGAARRRRSARGRRGLGAAQRVASAPAVERAGPGRLVPGGRGGGRGDPPRTRRPRSARWPGSASPARCTARPCSTRNDKPLRPGDPLERRPLLRRMRRTQAPRSRSRAAHRQSRHARLHRAEDAVGRGARARDRARDETRAAAQGLCAPAPLRRSRLGNVRRVGNAVARRGAAALGRGSARGDRAFARRHAAARRGLGGFGPSVARDRQGLGPRGAQDPDRGRRRRQRRLGDRRRRDRAGRGLRVARHVGRRSSRSPTAT